MRKKTIKKDKERQRKKGNRQTRKEKGEEEKRE